MWKNLDPAERDVSLLGNFKVDSMRIQFGPTVYQIWETKARVAREEHNAAHPEFRYAVNDLKGGKKSQSRKPRAPKKVITVRFDYSQRHYSTANNIMFHHRTRQKDR